MCSGEWIRCWRYWNVSSKVLKRKCELRLHCMCVFIWWFIIKHSLQYTLLADGWKRCTYWKKVTATLVNCILNEMMFIWMSFMIFKHFVNRLLYYFRIYMWNNILSWFSHYVLITSLLRNLYNIWNKPLCIYLNDQILWYLTIQWLLSDQVYKRIYI